MKKSCIVYVLWDINLQKHLTRLKSTNSKEKQRIIEFWELMMNKGYRHFYVYANSKVELWIIEILYYIRNAVPAISYSLILDINNKDRITTEHNWEEIAMAAKEVIYWKDSWMPLNYDAVVLDLYN